MVVPSYRDILEILLKSRCSCTIFLLFVYLTFITLDYNCALTILTSFSCVYIEIISIKTASCVVISFLYIIYCINLTTFSPFFPKSDTFFINLFTHTCVVCLTFSFYFHLFRYPSHTFINFVPAPHSTFVSFIK